MAEHDISLVTAKASNTVVENMKVALATASAAITPATVTAMAGLAQGGAIQIAPSVTAAIAGMQAHAFSLASSIPELSAELGNVGVTGGSGLTSASISTAIANFSNVSLYPTPPANISAITSLTAPGSPLSGVLSASSALSTQASQLLPAGNPAAFGSMLSQAQGHIADAIDLKKATDFMSSVSFEDMGAGITNMSSMTCQGLDGALGDLGAAASAFEAAGPSFDLNKMSSFGSPTGFIDKLNSVKLGNASGVNGAIAAAGLDVNNPEHADAISKVVGSIKDPAVIATITEQLKISPGKSLTSLSDFSDLSKLAPAGSSLASLSGAGMPDLKGMASKFTDMGAKFANPSAAADMLKGIQIPDVPTLNLATPSLSGMVADLGPTLDNMTGTGTGPMGLPSITDFAQSAAGGPHIDALNAALAGGDPAAIASASANVSSMVASASSLIAKAGMDLTVPPLPSMGAVMGFATSLHKMGADTSGSGISSILGNMVTNDKYGDAIKASLAEGKNKALMAAHGISPLNFGS